MNTQADMHTIYIVTINKSGHYSIKAFTHIQTNYCARCISITSCKCDLKSYNRNAGMHHFLQLLSPDLVSLPPPILQTPNFIAVNNGQSVTICLRYHGANSKRQLHTATNCHPRQMFLGS